MDDLADEVVEGEIESPLAGAAEDAVDIRTLPPSKLPPG